LKRGRTIKSKSREEGTIKSKSRGEGIIEEGEGIIE
jgi:hypothetical protein